MYRILKTFAYLIALNIASMNHAMAEMPSSIVNTDYYSDSYESARMRFRESSERLSSSTKDAQIWQFHVPSRTEPDLTVDYLYLPAQEKMEKLLIITSGVHGAEGFAGSAIQLMFMNEYGKNLDHKKTGYLIVHSLNPYGFKHHRRADEMNVNLNRNFSLSSELYENKNEGYLKLLRILEPQGKVVSSTSNLISTAINLGSRILFGGIPLEEFNVIIGQGQFDSPNGLEYGGKKAEPQVEDFLNNLKQISRPYTDIVLLDFHSGLGESYKLHLMPGDAAGSINKTLFSQLFDPKNESDIYEYTPSDSDGFYPIHGDLNNVLPQILSAEQRAVGVTLEFGTIGNGFMPKLKTLNSLILENQGFHFGYAHSRIEEKVKEDFTELFFPSDESWRKNVISKAREVLKRTLVRMNQQE